MITPINQRPSCPEREEDMPNGVNSNSDPVFTKSICHIFLFTLLLTKGGKGVNQEHCSHYSLFFRLLVSYKLMKKVFAIFK
jgi:hypothetical protein